MNFNKQIIKILEEIKCWDGYHKEGTKISPRTGKRVNNCVKNTKKRKRK